MYTTEYTQRDSLLHFGIHRSISILYDRMTGYVCSLYLCHTMRNHRRMYEMHYSDLMSDWACKLRLAVHNSSRSLGNGQYFSRYIQKRNKLTWWLGKIRVSAMTTFSRRPAARTTTSAISSPVNGSTPLLNISHIVRSNFLSISYL